MTQYNKFMGIFWLVMGIASLGFGIYMTIQHGFEDNWYIFLFSVMAFINWFLRKAYQKRQENK